MTVVTSFKAITAGAFGTFNLFTGHGSVDGYERSAALLCNADETFLDAKLLTPNGSITNPSGCVLTRPAAAVSSAVIATNASPCVFTWTGNPLANGQSVVLGGTPVPSGFTAGQPYFVVGVSGNNFSLSSSFGGTAINSTSTGTSVTAALQYVPNSLIGSAQVAGSVVVPSFTIPNVAGGFILSRIRVLTNATSGWGAANLSVNLWSAAPAYTTGDNQPYAPSGAASWLANFLVSLTQLNDGAVGAGGLTGAGQMALKLASGTSVFADIQALSAQNPIASQAFTIVPELMN